MKKHPKGIGMWIAFGNRIGTIDQIISQCKDMNISWLAPRISDGPNYDAFWSKSNSKNYIEKLHANSIAVYGWTYNRPGSMLAEIDIMKYQFECGMDGFILDAEEAYTNQFAAAQKFANLIKTNFPDNFVGFAPYSYVCQHGEFPYKELLSGCDAVFDQLYHTEFNNNGAPSAINKADSQWNEFFTKNQTLTKPRYPISVTYGRELGEKFHMQTPPPGVFKLEDLKFFIKHYESVPYSFYSLEAANDIFINYMKEMKSFYDTGKFPVNIPQDALPSTPPPSNKDNSVEEHNSSEDTKNDIKESDLIEDNESHIDPFAESGKTEIENQSHQDTSDSTIHKDVVVKPDALAPIPKSSIFDFIFAIIKMILSIFKK